MKSAPTCPPTRRSARVKSTLVYDQKYHPLDDVIRPSHAAKRRIIHGEQPLMASGSNGETPEELGSDVGSAAGDEDGDDGDLQPTPIRKRKRARPLTSKPIRHSSHRRSKPKTSYNMKLHPQDSDLKRVWACDGSKSSPSPTMEIFPAEAITSTNKTPSKEVQELYGTTLEGESEGMRQVQAHPHACVDHADHVQTRGQNQRQRFQTPLLVMYLLQTLLFSVRTGLPATIKHCVSKLDIRLLTRMHGPP